MALSSVFIRLALLIAPAVASTVVRRVVEANGGFRSNRVGSGSWSQAGAKSKSQVGLSFWRALRKELEEKKKSLSSADTRESSLLSTAARRDLMWQAVREVDDKFHKKYMCALDEGTTYAKESMFLQGQAAYSKASVASARECALMCAADSMADRSHKDLACKSFAFNKTAQECKFFNFAHEARNTQLKDACCTTGPPCNLESMREEIQTHFQTELKHKLIVAPKVEHKAAPQTKQVAPKVEQKVAVQIKPHVEQKAAPQTQQVAPKVAQKVVAQTKHAAPTVELKAAPQTKQVAPKVVQKVATHAPKVEQKAAAVPIAHAAPAASIVKHAPTHHRVHWRRWRRVIIPTVAGVVLVSILALACRFRGNKGGSLKQLGA